ncbi:thiamine-phosphate kinase [Bordetella holmesii]|uniref:Thiamine-monophosphate kinase n=2 Tax=Bordetella holmesii TaxID=35814 RepID=A0A158M174_9BORD|nr:thiamine-phosphate kinase [Bordetella holmesii]AHV91892.1 thiamine-monophosphate kinase [Bordetella holmesii ATCC 51541]AIT25069.1 thiamine-monophosphate kinase [Bordetella holmesii 44057]EWM45633.1 thiamine-monophosphate kinase [Bordetella holmesii 70147]EWM48893.1 thiamine-monophosphate kinase [Bordetella holmesii 41130]EWM49755.1 thiamine-monophosphate kinase [Bordetella holmesii 35009]
MASEFDLIARHFTRAAPGDILGVGDDCALFPVPQGMRVAVSKDLLIAGRHFYPDADPESVGHKSLAVNLSDLAAMGAQPLGCLLGLALPSMDEPWLAAYARGFHALAQASGCPLIGGDTTRSLHDLTLSVTVFGAVPAQAALRRDAARTGDDIWVSGELGAADIAYRLLDGQLPADAARLAQTRRALEWPQPRLALGAALRGLAHAAIDISDGLAQDLRHILAASGVAAELRYADLPRAAGLAGLDDSTLQRALLGGGDVYELCFTAPPERRAAIEHAALACQTPVSRVGRIMPGTGLQVLDAQGQPLPHIPGGFDHFGDVA